MFKKLLLFIIFSSLAVQSKDLLQKVDVDKNSKINNETNAPSKNDVINNPLLVLILMVKNEEGVINATIDPFVNAGVGSYFIFDTGSTDKTIETVKDYFKNNNINNYYVAQEPFVDFSTSRNRAIDLTKEKFPNSEFLLFIDAEWYVKNIPMLLKFCSDHKEDDCPLYLMRGNSGSEDFYSARLMRTKSNAKFSGVVHEVLMAPSHKKLPYEICFEYRPVEKGREKTAQRWLRDKELLLKEITKNPGDTRNTFYLAQTYECLGQLHEAHKYYEIRSKMNGFDEETYEAFFRLGRVTNWLSKIDNKFTWEQAHAYYLKAYKLRPHRAEPLIKIAEHYWPNDIPVCFLYAKRAFDLPYPEKDTLFVDKYIYEYEKFDMVSKSAWHVGEHDIGEQATLMAMKYKVPHLYHNLICYKDGKKNNK